MSTQDVTPRIELVFSKVFGKRIPFSAELSRLDEPQWTSLKHVEFIIGLEQEFDLRFDGADATDMTSIPVVVERVRNRLQ
jgi:acyl carrier protein